MISPLFLALVLAVGLCTAAISDSARPGDALYPVDRSVEWVKEALPLSRMTRVNILMRHAKERIRERNELIAIGDTVRSVEAQRIAQTAIEKAEVIVMDAKTAIRQDVRDALLRVQQSVVQAVTCVPESIIVHVGDTSSDVRVIAAGIVSSFVVPVVDRDSIITAIVDKHSWDRSNVEGLIRFAENE